MTEAMRKLPLSLTRLAAFGSSATTNVRCPMASKMGETDLYCIGFAGGHDEQLGRLGRLRPAEYGCGDEALPGLGMRGAQAGGEVRR